jgi:hypothetical protein
MKGSPGRVTCSFNNPSRFWNQQSFYTYLYYFQRLADGVLLLMEDLNNGNPIRDSKEYGLNNVENH